MPKNKTNPNYDVISLVLSFTFEKRSKKEV